MLAVRAPEGPQRRPANRVEQAAANFTIVDDPSKFPEPGENVQGGIPAGDLTATPKRGGTLHTDAGNYARLDPHFPSTPSSERFMSRNFASGLLTWDMKTNSPTLDLAESGRSRPTTWNTPSRSARA